MSKEIWLPDSKTHVVVEPGGDIKIWDSMVMEKKPLEKKGFGFEGESNDKTRADV